MTLALVEKAAVLIEEHDKWSGEGTFGEAKELARAIISVVLRHIDNHPEYSGINLMQLIAAENGIDLDTQTGEKP